MPDMSVQLCCPACDERFTPKRSNQQYCTTKCSKNAKRGDRTLEAAKRAVYHIEKALRLIEILYAVAPHERPGRMEKILSYIPFDASLRNLLTDPKLLRANPFECRKGLLPGTFRNFVQEANVYTRTKFGMGIRAFVQKSLSGKTIKAKVGWDASIDQGAVPRLTNLTHARCWHKPLNREVGLTRERELISDYERVASIVEETQARIDQLTTKAVFDDAA